MYTSAPIIRGTLCALMLGLAASASAVPEQAKPWTAVATTGTVDEADAGIVNLNAGTAGVTAVGTLDIRYNVVAVDGVFVPEDGIQMAVRYLDNGASARVKLTLYQYNIDSGISTAIMTFDSDNFAAMDGYQDQTIAACRAPLDFFNNAYYVAAQISKTAGAGAAGLAIMQLSGTLC